MQLQCRATSDTLAFAIANQGPYATTFSNPNFSVSWGSAGSVPGSLEWFPAETGAVLTGYRFVVQGIAGARSVPGILYQSTAFLNFVCDDATLLNSVAIATFEQEEWVDTYIPFLNRTGKKWKPVLVVNPNGDWPSFYVDVLNMATVYDTRDINLAIDLKFETPVGWVI